ncbi:MAG: hypothetical protein BGO82_11225 [Devosia sp. 67-54]|uniref:iron uptake transporter permease EfeU n=1 Tax=unclassified Devosia TaxID=196773 RepID=UPI00095BC2A1|nr:MULTISPECIES: iron uptake transporter permease EfeU [unclassified Devosia]MBN9304789.1 FTR1 family protein [Devosia sp.]OJX15250.1 MAG: hypothetical protein BGO82_11225 [Devosia sp. 67-54]
MLATLVIGLREGLEASLIVGIIAAFLRKNGHGLTAMWIGIVLAVLLSVMVGVALSLIEQALPQAAQEGMESVIGAIAIVFVTGMIVWMNQHARQMKRELEAEAAVALSHAGAYALASMAFLAVLKEGFETSVFLLATFSAAQSAIVAAAGAVIGLLLAVAIGWGIYAGGVRINLARFFRVTGAFLILVAAGLVISSLRTAHEAGWLDAGQQATVNLGWLVAPGTVPSALITGVLGIPADPRLIEVLGWLAYLVPVSIYVYWPPAMRPSAVAAARLRLGGSAALVLAAIAIATFYPTPQLQFPTAAPLVAAGQPAGTATLGIAAELTIALSGAPARTVPLDMATARSAQHGGVPALAWTVTSKGTIARADTTLSLDQIVQLAGGRLPVGINRNRNPGPFDASWSASRSTEVWTAEGGLIDADEHSTIVVTLSGGGLQTPRAVTIADAAGPQALASSWQVSDDYRAQVAAMLRAYDAARVEQQFWARQLPLLLVIAAAALAAFSLRRERGRPIATPSLPQAGVGAEDLATKGVPHVH